MLTVTVVGGELAAWSKASAALVTVTTQVPALVALSTSPVTEQPAVPALVTVKLSCPLPEPPLALNAKGVPSTAFVLVRVRGA